MSVEPGFGGQKMITHTLDKLRELKKVKEKILEALKFMMAYDLWEISTFKNYNLNFYTLNYTDFIRLFFSNDIKSLFQEIYYMAKEGLSPDYLLKLSPLERRIHFNIIEETKRSQNNETSYDFEKINICTHYQLEDGSLTDRLPYDIAGTPITPIYKTMEGWNCSLENYRSFDQLPKALLDYIEFIEAEVGVPITLVSTGPDRKQTITK
jgi:hypothetical protein